ncbi:cell division protein ZapA [Moraxella sp. Tifton1]|uniref:cell division protein ZapA n=1 Tax=Moraxella oculi TaxID=2940516 RepID=UPI002012B8E1|nr:cell division protein ZapA [Moraxella sp. Tifton1]MCL1623306.1 cell division protein ZapA [Moraxella sp. Tifton1]
MSHNTSTNNTKPQSVHISIAGTPHRIICPSDRVKSLEITADKLNEKIRQIRQESKGKILNNEELLVLVCLDLYDQVQELSADIHTKEQSANQAIVLIEKINKDAQSVLR